MDLGMNEEEFTRVLSMLGRARDEFDRIGKHKRAKDCENAIALILENRPGAERRPTARHLSHFRLAVAHLALCAAAILARPSALIVRAPKWGCMAGK